MDKALRRKLYRDVRAHLDRLSIRVTWIEGWERAESFPVLREAVLPRIRTGADYLVALHELGHIAYPDAALHVSDTGAYGIIACEGAAWAWAAASIPPALANALPPESWLVVGDCFGSHVAYAAIPTTPSDA